MIVAKLLFTHFLAAKFPFTAFLPKNMHFSPRKFFCHQTCYLESLCFFCLGSTLQYSVLFTFQSEGNGAVCERIVMTGGQVARSIIRNIRITKTLLLSTDILHKWVNQANFPGRLADKRRPSTKLHTMAQQQHATLYGHRDLQTKSAQGPMQ